MVALLIKAPIPHHVLFFYFILIILIITVCFTSCLKNDVLKTKSLDERAPVLQKNRLPDLKDFGTELYNTEYIS